MADDDKTKDSSGFDKQGSADSLEAGLAWDKAYWDRARAEASRRVKDPAKRRDTMVEYQDKGLDLFDQGDYDGAIAAFNEALRYGNYAGIYSMRGDAYKEKGDLVTAIKDYTAALNIEFPAGPFNRPLNYCYRGYAYMEIGEYKNAAADYIAALGLHYNNVKAADLEEQSVSVAYHNLGKIYDEVGDACEDLGHEDLAAEYYRKGAACGNRNSVAALAKRGIPYTPPKNPQKAFRELSAPAKGERKKLKFFGFLFGKKKEALPERTDESRAAALDAIFAAAGGNEAAREKDYERAASLYRKAAEQDNAAAQCKLGVYYEAGMGVEKDMSEAVRWYAKAAEQGHAAAQYCYGNCYHNGEGVEKDGAKAFHWYAKAAEQGYAGAQNNLGLCYQTGEGVEKDPAKAFYWYGKAAEQGNVTAKYNLGYCYTNGEGVEKDPEKAFSWYAKAAEQGNADAQNNLGWCYYNGEGVEKDDAKAFHWYAKAAEQGQVNAQVTLKRLKEMGKVEQ